MKCKIRTFLKISLILTFAFAILPATSAEALSAEPLNSPAAQIADDSNVVKTALFGEFEDDGKGCGVFTVINLVVETLTYGVGILGVLGITIVGIQYLTAGGDQNKTLKAKRRLFEIVIGLATYVVIWAALNWLLPGGILNASEMTCERVDHSSTVSTSNTGGTSGPSTGGTSSSSPAVSPTTSTAGSTSSSASSSSAASSATDTNAAAIQKINQTALKLAWPANTAASKYRDRATAAFTKAMRATGTNKGETGCRASGQSCGMFVGTVMRSAGIDPNFPTAARRIGPYLENSPNWIRVPSTNPQPGDVGLRGDFGHVFMYVKNKNGKVVTAEGSLCKYYGRLFKKVKNTSSSYRHYRYIGP